MTVSGEWYKNRPLPSKIQTHILMVSILHWLNNPIHVHVAIPIVDLSILHQGRMNALSSKPHQYMLPYKMAT